MVENSILYLHGPMSTSNSQDNIFRAWRHPHSSLISSLGFIITIVIVISLARERKTVPNDCAPELIAE